MNVRHRSLRAALGAGVIAATLLTAACGRGDTSSAAASGSIPNGPGFDGQTITLGVLGVTSGALAEPAGTILEGQQAYYNALNDRGGIDGKYKVKLVIRDTAYDPAKVIQEYNSTKDQVAAYTQVFGTAMEYAILPDLKSDQVLTAPSSAEGPFLKEKGIVLTTAPAEVDTINGLEWALKQKGKDSTVCYAAMEGALGKSTGKALDWAIDKLGATKGVSVTLPVTGDYTPQVQQLSGAKCDIVMTKGSGVVLTNLLGKASQIGFTPQWMAPASDWIPSMKDSPLKDYLAKHLVLVKDSTVYGDQAAAGMKDLVAAHDKYSPKVTPVWLYTNGYSTAMAMDQVLTQAVKNEDLSHAGIVDASNQLSQLDFQGIQGSMPWGTPDKRKPSSTYYIIGIDPASTTGMAVKESGLKADIAMEYPL
ncbi:ABC-type branched-chain amino acid transport system, substrate-binding protein [Raineyella antarctica]|uniref:ABC-type branched-chain amino acid transport system, substrate-binding protein n=1 Tax=Raineyella antarctica TaxID=1577474 RepID=A0A1G6HPU4_9ACTN|nr:ABC transporter substrate-binding protein [Raineyella antarctica]SDB96214.1 ABC-type branched-chain amino acid transport system, substrate-binding protein [Raineyella antarctica]